MGFTRQEYWNGLPFSFPGDLPDPGIKSVSPPLAGGLFTTDPSRKPIALISDFPVITDIDSKHAYHLRADDSICSKNCINSGKNNDPNEIPEGTILGNPLVMYHT